MYIINRDRTVPDESCAARKFRRSVCAAQKLSDGMLGIMAGSVTKLKCVINVTLDCNCCNLSESPV